MSAAATNARILALVNACLDVDSTDSNLQAYLVTLIERAKIRIAHEICFDLFPVHSAGTVVSGPDATEDISGLAAATLAVSAHGSAYHTLTLDLSACIDGDETAEELQAQIRALAGTDNLAEAIWSTVTVTWDDDATQYTITDGLLGRRSIISFGYVCDAYHVAQALKLTPEFGAVETSGTDDDPSLEAACAEIVIDVVRMLRHAPEEYGTTTDTATLRDRALQSAIREGRDGLAKYRRLHY